MLKPDVFLGLVVVSAITLVGGESRSDGSSDDRDHNGAGGGAGSSCGIYSPPFCPQALRPRIKRTM